MESGRYKGVVFVTDDDDELRESVRELLEQEGFIVLGARNGGEALARMRGISGPAVAIIDLVMPGIDGWELIETIRSDPDLKTIPIIVISAHEHEPLRAVDRVLAKPVVPSELLRHVVELCR